MNAFLQNLFQYNRHANQQVIHAMVNGKDISDQAVTLLSHMLNAHHIWNMRILGKPEQYGVWEEHAIVAANEIDLRNNEISTAIINQTHLEVVIHYRNSKGEKFQNTIEDVLFHIINHSTYHRGQLVQKLKTIGITPPATDYIFYKRN